MEKTFKVLEKFTPPPTKNYTPHYIRKTSWFSLALTPYNVQECLPPKPWVFSLIKLPNLDNLVPSNSNHCEVIFIETAQIVEDNSPPNHTDAN